MERWEIKIRQSTQIQKNEWKAVKRSAKRGIIFMKKIPHLALSLVVSAFIFAGSVQAQSPAAAAENEKAYDLLSNADYAGAATAYEEIIKGYPTDILIQSCRIQLAQCQLYTGQYDKALTNLDDTSKGMELTPDLVMLVDGLRPQIYTAKAAVLPAGDAGRKAAYEKAISSYSDFITKYPPAKFPETESAIYGRAMCNFQIEDYGKAAEDLELNIKNYPSSPSIPSTNNLLAITFAVQANQILTSEGGDKAKGLEVAKRAEDILLKIISDKKDLVLMNDANYQLGEIVFMRGAFSPEEERQAIYNKAAEFYLAILPKEDVEEMQKEKIKLIGPQRIEALRAKNMVLKKKLEKDLEREAKRLSEIAAKPDQTATAFLKVGEIFFNSGKHNESRVIISHIAPFLTSEDEKMRALYYKTMGYAVQGVEAPAVKGYEEFVASYKGKPIAENLPFLIGNLYLSQGKNEESIRFFDESIQQYPKGRLSGLSVAQKAQAQVALKKYDEALKTFQDTLAQNPTPDIGLIAQYGIANIYRDTARWDEALAAFKATKEKYGDTPQGIESGYWVAACMQQKGDNAGAAPVFEAFIKDNADHALLPLATYALGNAQIANGQKDAGVATLAQVVEKFPDSSPAPYTYFSRAQVFAAAQKPDEVMKLMREFIEKYPKDDKIFFAYSSIAQNSIAGGKPDEAMAAYSELVEKYPENPNASGSLVKIADLQRAQADRLATNYSSLKPEDREKWKTAIDASIASLEKLIANYPQSADIVAGLQSLLTSQRALLRSSLKTDADVETYFQEVAGKTSDPAAKSKILFALAGFISEKDKPRALTKMNEAYNASVVYSPKDLDIYGLALAESGKVDEAQAVFEKLAADYPIPEGVKPSAAPTIVQEAQATALFGKGRVAQERKQTIEAGKLFEQLKTDYSWSPKVLEANYGIAQSLRAENKADDAIKLLGTIIRAQNATAELRANSFLLYGYIMKDKSDKESDPKKKEESRASAVDFFMKIPQFYSGVPAAAVPGLFEGAQLMEQQAAASADPKFKAQQLGRAKASYDQIVKDFPNDKLAPQAKARAQALAGS